MNVETISLRPHAGMFLKYFLLTLLLLLVLKTALHLLMSASAAALNSLGWWASLVLLALGTSTGVTLGARRCQLTIADVESMKQAKDWTLDYFLKAGSRIKENEADRITLESVNGFNRMFGNWFGTESITITLMDNKIIIQGPARQVELADSSLRFSKPLG